MGYALKETILYTGGISETRSLQFHVINSKVATGEYFDRVTPTHSPRAFSHMGLEPMTSGIITTTCALPTELM